MTITENFKMIFKTFTDVAPAVTSGALVVTVLSCASFVVQTYLSLTEGAFSIGAAVFQSGHLHTLLMYPFYHRTATQLLLNITSLLFLCSGVEKGVGTVRFLFLFLLLSSSTGSIYSFLDLLQDADFQRDTEGLLPVTLACLSLTTMHTKTARSFLCGLSFPTMALPWVVLIICTALIPRCVLLCNVIAILIGWACGRGRLSLLGMSESRAAHLEKMLPFRLLKSVSGGTFIPAATEERRKTLLPQINPTPGSYPVQHYAPLSNVNAATAYEGWPLPTSSVSSSSSTTPVGLHGHLPALNFGHSHGHNHNHSHGHNCNHSHGHNCNHGHIHGQQ